MTSVAEIAHALGRAQRLSGGGFLASCPCSGHGQGRGDRSPSLQISDSGNELRVHCHAGCDWRDVLVELRRRGLIDDRVGHPPQPKPAPKRTVDPREYEQIMYRRAAHLWARRKLLIGSPAEVYLRQARGLSCPLPFQTLAYSPPSDRYPPALIAAYGIPGEGEPGELGMLTEVNAVQLTFITENGDKADVTPRKRTIARPLNRPIVVAPFTDSLGLWIAEGVEDALSMYQATGLAAWAAGGATFLPGLADAVPWFVETINVLVDGNEIGRRESAKLADRLHAINRERAEAMRQRGEFPYHFEVPLRELPS